MHKRERVCRRSGRRHPEAPTGLQVGRVREAGQVSRPGGGDGRLLMRASRPHLDDRPAPSRGDHTSGGGGDRAVVVEHRQDERLEHDTFSERPRNAQDRRAREEQLALGVPVDVSLEAVLGEPQRGLLVDHAALQQEPHLGVAEPVGGERLDQPGGAGHDTVAAAGRQTPGEHLENAVTLSRAVLERRRDHRQLVVVREQGRVHDSSVRVGIWSAGTRQPDGHATADDAIGHDPCRVGTV